MIICIDGLFVVYVFYVINGIFDTCTFNFITWNQCVYSTKRRISMPSSLKYQIFLTPL